MAQSAEELRQEIAHTRAELSGTLDAIGDRVSPGRVIERKKNRMTSSMQSVRDRVMGSAHDAKEAVVHEAHAVAAHAGEAKDGAVDTVRQSPTQVAQRTQGAPLVAGAIALGVGFLVASAIPPSRKEAAAGSALLDKLEPVKAELKATAQEVAEHLKEPAADAAAVVKDAAMSGAHDVGDAAKGAVHETQEHAAAAVEAVKSDDPL